MGMTATALRYPGNCFKIEIDSTTSQWREDPRLQFNGWLEGLHANQKNQVNCTKFVDVENMSESP